MRRAAIIAMPSQPHSVLSRKSSWRGAESIPLASHHAGGQQNSKKNTTLDWVIALVAYFHSTMVIFVGTMLLLSLAPPSWYDWRFSPYTTSSTSSLTTHHAISHSHATTTASTSTTSHNTSTSTSSTPSTSWLSSPTSSGQSILFLLSTIYFMLDILALYVRHRLHTSKGQRILAHHLLSIIGLLYPVYTGLDGPIVLFGFVMAECSNPPFHVLTLCKYAVQQTKANHTSDTLRSSRDRTRASTFYWICTTPIIKRIMRPILYVCLSMDLSLVHVLIFLLSRMACLQFTAHAVMPFAALLSTKVTSIILCLLSVILFIDLCKTLALGETYCYSPTSVHASQTLKRVPTGGHAHNGGWKHIMMQMRELQEECDSVACESSNETDTHDATDAASSPYDSCGHAHGGGSSQNESYDSDHSNTASIRSKNRGSGSSSKNHSPKRGTSPHQHDETQHQHRYNNQAGKKLTWQ